MFKIKRFVLALLLTYGGVAGTLAQEGVTYKTVQESKTFTISGSNLNTLIGNTGLTIDNVVNAKLTSSSTNPSYSTNPEKIKLGNAGTSGFSSQIALSNTANYTLESIQSISIKAVGYRSSGIFERYMTIEGGSRTVIGNGWPNPQDNTSRYVTVTSNSVSNPIVITCTSNSGNGDIYVNSIEFTATYSHKEYLFNFSANAVVAGGEGGTVSASVADDQIQAGVGETSASTTATYTVTSTASGYAFEGWYSDEACTQLVSKEPTCNQTINNSIAGSTANKTLYANFIQDLVPDFDAISDQNLKIDETYDVTFRFTSADVPSASSDADFYYTISNSDVISFANNTITALKAGTSTITFTQKHVGVYQAASKTITITVSKHDVQWTWNESNAPYYYGTTINNILNIAAGDPSLVTFQSDNENVAVVENGTLIIKNIQGTANITVTSAENDRWKAKEQIFTVTPIAKGILLIDDATYSISDNGAFNWDDKYVDVPISGSPYRIVFNTATTSGIATGIDFRVYESADGQNFGDPIWSSTEKNASGDVRLNSTTKVVRLLYSGNYGATYSNVKVYLAAESVLTTDKANIELSPIHSTATFNVTHANAKSNAITVTAPEGITLTGNTTIAAGMDVYGEETITVGYTDEAPEEGVITITDGTTTREVHFVIFSEQIINVSAAGFATYAPAFNAEITRNDEGEVWYVSDWTATTLTFTKYEGTTLKAGEGVLLKKGNTSVTFTPTDAECQALAGNKLKGNIVPTAFSEGEIFILSNGDNGVGFYPNAEGTLKAGKAYLLRSEWETAIGSAIGAFQMLFDDEETGIGNVNENVNENQSIYNLAGQRIAGLQKGINIVNGKKILK